MKMKPVKKTKNIYTILSVLTILIGVLLIIYMIKVEDEPGALPLFLIIIGTVWFVVNQVQIKKRRR